MTYEFLYNHNRYEYNTEAVPEDALFNRTQCMFCHLDSPGCYVDLRSGTDFCVMGTPSNEELDIRVSSRMVILDKW